MWMNPSKARRCTWSRLRASTSIGLEIPVQPKVVSVGYVITAVEDEGAARDGRTVERYFSESMEKFPRFEALLAEKEADEVNVRSFRARAFFGTAGPNWVIVGEAAAMVDPITSNGVTAAYGMRQRDAR